MKFSLFHRNVLFHTALGKEEEAGLGYSWDVPVGVCFQVPRNFLIHEISIGLTGN